MLGFIAFSPTYDYCRDLYKMDSSAEGGIHAKLISGLVKSPDTNDKKIGYILQQLKALRTTADYDLSSTVTANDKDTTLLQTERLISILPK